MRISTAQMYRNVSTTITDRQSEVMRIQNQLSSGKRISALSDDPAAASGASVIRSSLAANAQFEDNRQIAGERLSAAESTLGVVSESLQSARELLVSAGNGGLSDADRHIIAGQLKERLSSLISLANASDGRGGYLFGGNYESSPPFVASTSGVTYVGDDGARHINVSPSRTIGTTFNGADVFSRIPSGNGVFKTSAAPANSGTAIVDSGRVSDAAALTGRSYEIRFHGSGASTTFDVWDATGNSAVSTGLPFTSPGVIALPGISVGISGAPADGDTFAVEPAGNQDLFATLQKAIELLSTPAGTNVTRITNGLRGALSDLDQSLSVVSDRRGAAGARLNELDQIGLLSSARDVDMKSTLSSLEDVDYAKTISELSVAQTGLKAALDSYSRISKTTLFDYIR